MSHRSQPVSLVAERAVRYLRRESGPVNSVRLAQEVLATSSGDEATATKVLTAAFGGDPRLIYDGGSWKQTGDRVRGEIDGLDTSEVSSPEHDLAYVLLEGGRVPGRREYRLTHVLVVRHEVGLDALTCGGDPSAGSAGEMLRSRFLEAIRDAVVVTHDPPGALTALERWLDVPLGSPISIRRLARERLDLPAGHSLEDLVARLRLPWRETGDRLEMAEMIEVCLESLREPGETLRDLLRDSNPGAVVIDWSRVEFDREFLRSIPATPGTYRFLDRDGRLLYVGKSKNLRRRVCSYFRHASRRPARIKAMLDELHSIEIEPSGSDLEAVLREAEQISRDRPSTNVQRQVHPRKDLATRLRSILILEPAVSPLVLRAYLIRDGRLVDKIGIGPRGGGLRRIERILGDRFFSVANGPSPVSGSALDVELVVRWLASNRDRVVAFDPTDLASPCEVTDRLRWFLAHGGPLDPDGTPILSR